VIKQQLSNSSSHAGRPVYPTDRCITVTNTNVYASKLHNKASCTPLALGQGWGVKPSTLVERGKVSNGTNVSQPASIFDNTPFCDA
jgi:hypothetical protein